jgi:hypothetical protein
MHCKCIWLKKRDTEKPGTLRGENTHKKDGTAALYRTAPLCGTFPEIQDIHLITYRKYATPYLISRTGRLSHEASEAYKHKHIYSTRRIEVVQQNYVFSKHCFYACAIFKHQPTHNCQCPSQVRNQCPIQSFGIEVA